MLGLKNVIITILKFIRKMDLSVRYGWEEFLVVLPETNMEGAVFFSRKDEKSYSEYID